MSLMGPPFIRGAYSSLPPLLVVKLNSLSCYCLCKMLMFITVQPLTMMMLPASIPHGCYGDLRHHLEVPGFPHSSAGKESACNAGDLGLIPGLGRSPGEGKGYPLQYSGLENSMDCIVQGTTKSWTRLSDFHLRYQVLYIHGE